jgi:L-alanine-DL-glutamate epimerase-like enolase superfamily enzyme
MRSFKEPFEWKDGDLIPLERPGIGIELDEKQLEKYKGSLADFRRR